MAYGVRPSRQGNLPYRSKTASPLAARRKPRYDTAIRSRRASFAVRPAHRGDHTVDSRDCQFLIDLYEMKSITKVAQKYYLSQPAMTKRLQRLEEEFGCTILLRRKKGVSFTAVGEQVLPYCRSMLRLNQEMMGTINRHQGIVGGSLSILCSLSYSYYRLPWALNLYCQRYPMVGVTVQAGQSGPLYYQFLKNESCIAILRGERAWGDGRIRLDSEPLCLVCSHENASRALKDYSYIASHTDQAVVSQIERWALEQNLPLYNTKLSVNNINCCKEMARLGLGWSILPRTCLDDFDGTVRPLCFQDGSPLKRDTYVLYHSSYHELQQVRLFLDTLVESERLHHHP